MNNNTLSVKSDIEELLHTPVRMSETSRFFGTRQGISMQMQNNGVFTEVFKEGGSFHVASEKTEGIPQQVYDYLYRNGYSVHQYKKGRILKVVR